MKIVLYITGPKSS